MVLDKLRVFGAVMIFAGVLMASAEDSDADDSNTKEAADTEESGSEVVAPPEDVSPIMQAQHTWIDSSHSWLYNNSQDAITWFDGLFVAEGEKKIKTPKSRFRLGLYSEFNLESDRDFKLSPIIDLSTDVELPNLERRLKLFITTRDPTALPDEDTAEANNELRVGASRDFFKNWRTSVGVKARWPPEPYANVSWSRVYKLPNWWRIYPKIKPFWDTNRGFGGLTSLVVDTWSNRWLFRQTGSIKWDQKNYEDDKDSANDPTSTQFGENGEGYRWSVSSVVGFVPLLLDEENYGRRVSGSDIADGWGVRGRIDGNIAQTLSYDITFFRKGPLYKDYIFYVISPEVQWEQSNNWKAEYTVQIGVEILMWGQKTTRTPSQGF